MDLRIRNVLLLLITLSITIGCFVGCSILPTDGDASDDQNNNAAQGENKNPVEAKYDTLPYSDYVIMKNSWYDESREEHIEIKFDLGGSDMLVISTFEEYAAAGIYDFERDEEFFVENSLLVMKYTYTSSDEMIEFIDIAIKDGKLYPVVSMEHIPGTPITDDYNWIYIIADVKKSDIENYSFGEVLALNLADENDGSVYHEKFE